MFKSYFKTALRFLLKNKTFSFINIFGLAAGTLCCLYIVLYVQDQYSYDRHHADVKDVYRVDQYSTGKGKTYTLANTAAPMTPAMKHDFSQVAQFTRVVPFLGVEKHLLRYQDKMVWEKDAVVVDSTFFDVFSYHAVNGNLSKALVHPYSVVLLKPTADKLFGREDPIGKTITIDNVHGKHDYTVNGVVDESLGKSHLHAGIFITMNSGSIGDYMLHTTLWASEAYIGSYIRLQPHTNAAELEKQFPAFIGKYADQEFKKWGVETRLFLQPISSIHTTPGFDNPGIGKPVNPSFLNTLILIAVLIQIIACINFMNLSTARASKRAKEVGVRKVIGAGRNDLIKQFLGESLLLSLIGVLIAVPLLLLLLPFLNQITQTVITTSFLSDLRVWQMLTGLVLLTGLVAGSYPAFYLSAFKAIKVIKGNFTSHISAAGIRRGLVVFQFVISIALITGIVVIFSQLRYIKNKDLGFDQDQRILFSFNSGDSFDQIRPFMNDLRRLAEIKEVSNASRYLSDPSLFSNGFVLPGQDLKEAKPADYIISDEYFVKANGIKLLSGRDFRGDDSAKLLINETYARKLGIDPLHASGIRLHDSQSREVEIVGVMKDFNYWSLHEKVDGFALLINKSWGLWHTVTVHSSTANYKSLLSKMESIWKKDVAGVPFEYAFLDEKVQLQYETDLSLSRIINAFTGMAVLISCLGLFGLAAFSAEQRSKEISVRKILGASVPGIAQLLSKDFLRLVIIAYVIATPIAWWGMDKWLQAFAYKVPIAWWMFVLSGVIVMLIALLTVSFQAIKAAVANPVRALRAE